MACEPQNDRVIVRDESGCEWTLSVAHNLDPGVEYLLGARWLPADHPLVQHELQKVFGQNTDAA